MGENLYVEKDAAVAAPIALCSLTRFVVCNVSHTLREYFAVYLFFVNDREEVQIGSRIFVPYYCVLFLLMVFSLHNSSSRV